MRHFVHRRKCRPDAQRGWRARSFPINSGATNPMQESNLLRWRVVVTVCVWLSVGVAVTPALGLIVVTRDDTDYKLGGGIGYFEVGPQASVSRAERPDFEATITSAPSDDPGWNNVGSITMSYAVFDSTRGYVNQMSQGSTVYLGDRWVITGYHVVNQVFDADRFFHPITDPVPRIIVDSVTATFPSGEAFDLEIDLASSTRKFSAQEMMDANSFKRLRNPVYPPVCGDKDPPTQLCDGLEGFPHSLPQNPLGTGQLDPTATLTQILTGSLSEFTDLAMFRLAEDPGLPELTVTTVPPAVGEPVRMIGTGNHRGPSIDEVFREGESPFHFDNEFVWRDDQPPRPVRGYYVDVADGEHRWGDNVVADDDEADADHLITVTRRPGDDLGDVISLRTVFDDAATVKHQAQAASGDSGGGVFVRVGDQWQLAGILDASLFPPGQRSDSKLFPIETVFGERTNDTLFADLSKYRTEIERIMSEAETDAPVTAQQIVADPLDVNGDGAVSPIDAVQVLNDLNNAEAEPAIGLSDIENFRMDVNGDGHVSPIDALIIINALNRAAATSLAEAEGEAMQPVPEGTTLLPAALTLAAFFGCRRRRKD